ncbi:MAG: putative rhamnosyl transferase [Pseudomonadota bacterium]
MEIIGLCRFSYPALGGFQVEHDSIEERIAYLYSQERLEERFKLFEAVALPCLNAQTDTDFTLIVVVGDQLPQAYRSRLAALVSNTPQITLHAEPPRRQREVMKETLNDARSVPAQPCLQFRFDDDDAVSIDFVAKLRRAAADCHTLTRQHRCVAFDWNQGFVAEFSQQGISAVEMHRPFYVASLGMHIQANCALTIMNFAHEKIPRFMPTVSFADPEMWVRSHNEYNDSRQKPVKAIPVTPLTAEQEEMFKQRFAIDAHVVRRVFSNP